ncbi:hypothetical protein KIL84_004771 [Mauremys mutica]|uniref:Uncharacterized protein n=1 Tax=Mauremys mutica TaxID=74926 RepID=A0A9D3XKR9_9SAUR|nr:hypothetical protein KIL84_004771 [Mauremys mutica]
MKATKQCSKLLLRLPSWLAQCSAAKHFQRDSPTRASKNLHKMPPLFLKSSAAAPPRCGRKGGKPQFAPEVLRSPEGEKETEARMEAQHKGPGGRARGKPQAQGGGAVGDSQAHGNLETAKQRH